MALPNTNITAALVQSTINAPSYKVSELCKSDNINMFSRYKPTRVAGTPTEWWKGDSTNYSLSVPVWNRSITGQTWTYLKPQGGTSSPYRLGDFRYYNHDAVNPVQVVNYNNLTYNLVESRSINFMHLMPANYTYQLGIGDFLPGYHFGVEVENSTGSIKWASAVTGSTVTLNYNISPFNDNSWKGDVSVRFFLVNALKDFEDAEISNTRYALHHEDSFPSDQTITVVETATVECELTGMRRLLSSGTWVSADPDFDNPMDPIDGYYTQDSIAFKCRFRSKTGSNITVSGNEFTFGISATYLTTNDWYVYFSNNMYSTTGSAISSVVAPAGSWGTEIILYNASMFNRNSSGNIGTVSTGLELWTSFIVKQDDLTLTSTYKKFTSTP